jgi:hypothetical protein
MARTKVVATQTDGTLRVEAVLATVLQDDAPRLETINNNALFLAPMTVCSVFKFFDSLCTLQRKN